MRRPDEGRQILSNAGMYPHCGVISKTIKLTYAQGRQTEPQSIYYHPPWVHPKAGMYHRCGATSEKSKLTYAQEKQMGSQSIYYHQTWSIRYAMRELPEG